VGANDPSVSRPHRQPRASAFARDGFAVLDRFVGEREITELRELVPSLGLGGRLPRRGLDIMGLLAYDRLTTPNIVGPSREQGILRRSPSLHAETETTNQRTP
jgi:hypothetical protein